MLCVRNQVLTEPAVFDDFLMNPLEYRKTALATEFKSYDFGHCIFHGISVLPVDGPVPAKISAIYPEFGPSLTFLRMSPEAQAEPHFIHTDADMGDWSAIYYMNPDPPKEDGTAFWTHRESGAIESAILHERSEEGKTENGWTLRALIRAKFNRLLVFPSTYFHSRSIYANWGTGLESRLTQVVFGTERGQ